MKKLHYVVLILLIMSLASCSNKKEAPKETNPLLLEFNTPFEVPPFEQIKNEHFKPAFDTAFKRHVAEIEAIVNNNEKPSFQNTIEALDYAGQLLNRVSAIFFNQLSANTGEELQAIAQEISPKMAEHYDNIMLNARLYDKVKVVYAEKDKLNLNPEQMRLLEETNKRFVRNGAALDESKQKRLREINQELSTQTLKFGDNVLAETNAYKLFIEKKEDLSGLPQGIIDGAAEAAKADGKEGQWLFTLQNPSIMPFLQYADNRELRKNILTAYASRGNNNNDKNNTKLITSIVNLRLEKAKLLGYTSHAAYVLEDNMAKTPEKVYALVNQIWVPGLAVAKKEAADLQKMIKKDKQTFKLEPCDWRYYAEKLRKEKYALDEEAIRPYFKLENVREGIFTVAQKLYGITFTAIKDIPKYHPDVEAYEVKEADGKHLGLLYLDFFPRESKRGGAWMTSYREQYKKDGKDIRPVVSIVCNFSKPTEKQPSLLTYDEVETFFHEFGHGLHGLLSNTTYSTTSGTNVSRDFVELPSQIMENWAAEPEVLKMFAKHYETGEVIPDALIEKITKSSLFNQGFATIEFLAAALLDMDYHTITEPMTVVPNDFEKAAMDKIGLIPEIIVRYKSTYFNHIFSGGYSAGYYSYIWSEVLDSDAFQAFKEKGLFDKATATSFRKNILEKGNTEDPMQLYIKFRGAEPKIDALLEKRGLK